MRSTAPDTVCANSAWLQSPEAHRVIERIRHTFPLSRECSIRRVALAAHLSLEPGTSENTLVVDAVLQLSKSEA